MPKSSLKQCFGSVTFGTDPDAAILKTLYASLHHKVFINAQEFFKAVLRIRDILIPTDLDPWIRTSD